MKTLTLIFLCLSMAFAETRKPQTAQMSADERIAFFEKSLKDTPSDLGVQAGLASAFIQKMRETTDFAYLNRAAAIVDKMLAADPKSYDGIRLSAEIETHRHNFPRAAELASTLLERNPSDAGALGLLGDSLMELGQYDSAPTLPATTASPTIASLPATPSRLWIGWLWRLRRAVPRLRIWRGAWSSSATCS